MMSTVIEACTGMNNHPVFGSDSSIKLSRNTPAASNAERMNNAAPVNPATYRCPHGWLTVESTNPVLRARAAGSP